MQELIRLSRMNPRTVLFITHSVEEAVYLSDRVVVLTGRPGRTKEIINIAEARRQENWIASSASRTSWIWMPLSNYDSISGGSCAARRLPDMHSEYPLKPRCISAWSAATNCDGYWRSCDDRKT